MHDIKVKAWNRALRLVLAFYVFNVSILCMFGKWTHCWQVVHNVLVAQSFQLNSASKCHNDFALVPGLWAPFLLSIRWSYHSFSVLRCSFSSQWLHFFISLSPLYLYLHPPSPTACQLQFHTLFPGLWFAPSPLYHTHTPYPFYTATHTQSAWTELKNCHASSIVQRPFWIYDCALNTEASEWVAAAWMTGSLAGHWYA